jgi:hypothetical protein
MVVETSESKHVGVGNDDGSRGKHTSRKTQAIAGVTMTKASRSR